MSTDSIFGALGMIITILLDYECPRAEVIKFKYKKCNSTMVYLKTAL